MVAHPKEAGGNTFMTRGAVAQPRQLLMLLILLRSLRYHERVCRRPFVLLRGTGLALPPADVAALESEGPLTQVEIGPIKLGVPPFDKLHAWNLSAQIYRRVLVIDADAMMLGPVEELFSPQTAVGLNHQQQPQGGGGGGGGGSPRVDHARADGGLLTMAHHGYDKSQEQCSIPLARRGVGGFYVMSPDAHEFSRLVHVTTRFKEEQTGVACYFHRRSRLATLPCPYFYDIAYEQHVPGGTHHSGCLNVGVGTLGPPGAAQCNASAEHVKQHCTWEASYKTAKAVHFKGSAKPWRVFSCFGLREGRLRLSPSNLTLGPNDVLTWDPDYQSCVSRTHSGSHTAPAGVGHATTGPQVVTYGRSGVPLPHQCCRFTSLIKAEWWQHYRSGERLPSLGAGDSWVRLGRWVRNKNNLTTAAISRRVASWWRVSGGKGMGGGGKGAGGGGKLDRRDGPRQ